MADAAKSFRYIAFISYRHAPVDRTWARWLHTALETYRTPSRLRGKGISTRIGRCFRDEEELSASADLSSSIRYALDASQFLVVVCSPRTPSSRWVNQEIEYFRSLDRSSQILSLLIEGSPEESFPSALCQIRDAHQDVATDESRRHSTGFIEPLAADVRPDPHVPKGSRRRDAKLRLIATILGVSFDDLKQRDSERRQRRLVRFSGTLVLVAAVMAGLTAFAIQKRAEAVTQTQVAQAAQAKADMATARAQMRLRESLMSLGDAQSDRLQWHLAVKSYFEADAITIAATWDPTPLRYRQSCAIIHAPPPIQILTGHQSDITVLAINSNGTLGVTGDSGGQVVIWDLVQGLRRRTIDPENKKRIRALSICSDERTVAVSTDGNVSLWNLFGDQHEPTAVFECAGEPKWLKLNKTTLVAASVEHAWVWNIVTHKLVAEAVGSGHFSCVELTGDGALCFAGNTVEDRIGRVFVWDAVAGARFKDIGPVQPPAVARVTHDRRRLLIGSGSNLSAGGIGAIQTIDLATGKALRGPQEFGHIVEQITITPDDKCIISSGSDGAIRVYDSVSGSQAGSVTGYDVPLKHTAVSGDGKFAFSAAGAVARLWSLTTAASPEVMRMESGIQCLCPAFGRMALIGADVHGNLALWDTMTLKPLWSLEGNGIPITSMAVSPDSRTFVTGSSGGEVVVRDLHDGRPIHSLQKHDGRVTAVKFSTDGTRILTLGNHLSRLWALPKFELIAEAMFFETLADGVDLDSSTDEVRVAQRHGGTYRLPLHDGNKIKNFPALQFKGALAKPGYDFDANIVGMNNHHSLLTSIGSRLVEIDADSADVRRDIGVHDDIVKAVATAEDGRWIASGGFDRVVCVWDGRSDEQRGGADMTQDDKTIPAGPPNRLVARLHGHDDVVRCVVFSDDGTILYSGDGSGSIHAWDLNCFPLYRETLKKINAGRALETNDHVILSPEAKTETGVWYSRRHLDDWAAALLTNSSVSHEQQLALGRSLWRTSDFAGAEKAFLRVTEFPSVKRDEVFCTYIQLCVNAVRNEGRARNPKN